MTPATRAVVEALADDLSGWHHGYDLMARTGLKSGSLYPILIRLDERGFLEASWERDGPPGRPPRHLYRLTSAGRELVDQVKARAVRAAPPKSYRLGEARWART
jgi:DNA-binding PadR family transcriptional regulator